MGIINWIKSLFNKALRLFREFIDTALPLASQIITGQLKTFAINTIKELALTDLDNEEKRKQAFQRIKQYAVNIGINVRDSLLNLIIELAVSFYKNKRNI